MSAADKRSRDRWAFLSGLDIGADGDPYLDRLRIVQTPLFGIYLHHIHRQDRELDPHDHPWWFASLILAGWYEEIVWRDKHGRAAQTTEAGQVPWVRRERGRWSLRAMPQHSAHIITLVRGPLWTLVLTGPKRSGWGFWTQAGFVPWRDYQYAPSKED